MTEFEYVHTMTDYYDGPRGGIADYQGKPHVYESLFSDSTGYLDAFRLSPVEDDLFELALEDWQIWLRWETAYHAGLTTHETHPALPEDRKRHDEITAILEKRLAIDESNFITVRGEFRVRSDGNDRCRGWRPLEVKWVET